MIFYFFGPRDDFKDYSDVLFKTFGDRVKRWITLNEPKIVALYGYENGWAPPGRCSVKGLACVVAGDSTTEPYLVAHNLILAHAAAYRLYQEKYKVCKPPTKPHPTCFTVIYFHLIFPPLQSHMHVIYSIYKLNEIERKKYI